MTTHDSIVQGSQIEAEGRLGNGSMRKHKARTNRSPDESRRIGRKRNAWG